MPDTEKIKIREQKTELVMFLNFLYDWKASSATPEDFDAMIKKIRRRLRGLYKRSTNAAIKSVTPTIIEPTTSV